MSRQTRLTLKSFFETGDKPTQQQFADWIDSQLNFADDGIDVVGGKVGIGTTAPNAPLEVVGDTPGSIGGFPAGSLQVRSLSTGINANAVITGHNAFGGNKQLWYLGSSSSNNDNVIFINRQNASMQFGTNGLTVLSLSAPGNVGIGTASPGAKLDVNGRLFVAGTGLGNFPLEMGSGAHVTVGGVWTNASSRDYKKNVRRLTKKGALSILDALVPVSFEYKNGGEKHLGFIAEDVPEEVASPDRKGLSPMDFVAVLVTVVQDLRRKVSTLEAQLVT